MREKLYRSHNSMIAGVCAGLAEWTGLSVALVRLVFFFALFCWGTSFWIYLLLAIIMPKRPVNCTTYNSYKTYNCYGDSDSAYYNTRRPRYDSTSRRQQARRDKEAEWDSKFHDY